MEDKTSLLQLLFLCHCLLLHHHHHHHSNHPMSSLAKSRLHGGQENLWWWRRWRWILQWRWRFGFGLFALLFVGAMSPNGSPRPNLIYFLAYLVTKHLGLLKVLGEGVTEFEVGDHVLTVFIGECKSCRHCISGKSNMCQKLGLERKGVMHRDQKTRFSIKGRPIYHYCTVSSFSEYTEVHSGCAVKVSPTAPMDRICLLSCGVAAGIGAAWKVADISEGSTVVIFGLGL